MVNQKRVLVLDDDIEVCTAIKDYLSGQSYGVHVCTEVNDFLEALTTYVPQFILMDKYVHKYDCVPLIDKIRKNETSRGLPILLMTGCTDFEQKLQALDIGADDVLIKPLRLAEINSKLKAIGRRSASYQEYSGTIKYKNLTLNLQNEEVSTADDVRIDLTKTEFKIFHLLLQAKGSVVVREQMARRALTVRNHNVRTIDVHINALRIKLGDHGRKIRTLRGRGYVLTD